MAERDTILIFQKPDLYFFPHYKDIVFSPFRIPERSLRYLIYKGLYLLGIPLCSVFWGHWKDHLKEAKRVIIFDYGYQKGMETYIHKVNPHCQVYLFLWNMIDRLHKNHTLFTDPAAIYSTDKGDCRTYHLKYNHIFYPRALYTPPAGALPKTLFFLGQDKGRGSYLLALKDRLETCGLSCSISLLTSSKDADYLASLSGLLAQNPLPYPEYCRQLKQCGYLLDVNQEGQTALTMRVMESIFYSKKLITNNQDIVNYDFYNENNIFLLPQQPRLPSQDALSAFLDKPFLPYGEAVLDSFSFEHWKAGFTL